MQMLRNDGVNSLEVPITLDRDQEQFSGGEQQCDCFFVGSDEM